MNASRLLAALLLSLGLLAGPAPAGAPSLLVPLAHATDALPSVAPGSTVQGLLQPGQSQQWMLAASPGMRIRIEVGAPGFTPTLALGLPDGQQVVASAASPGADGTTAVSHIHKVTQHGPHRVIVGGAPEGSGGQYVLRVSQPEGPFGAGGTIAGGAAAVLAPQVSASTRPAEPSPAGPAASVLRGQGTFQGHLQSGDATLSSGEFVRWYELEGPAGQAVTLTLESDVFDTYLILAGPDGYQEDNDDGPGMGTNSRLEVGLPTTGLYRVGVTSYRPGETGPYVLRIEPGTTLQRARRPDVYAVIAGMTEYPTASDRLPWCAEDARRLYRALQDTGRLAPVSVLLTDRQVTTANLRDAVLRVAESAGPDDVFLFFFSGHGNQRPALEGGELDGLDEVITVWDGDVRDNEVARWFDRSRARLSILALDACHAGGFARDVISAPGRLGIFSSEEDVLSLVAERFEAGGYLAHFLREAFEGAADTDPADGVLTVGELTQFLRRQWAEHVLETRVSTGDGRRTYQNLVIERGAVHVDEIVL